MHMEMRHFRPPVPPRFGPNRNIIPFGGAIAAPHVTHKTHMPG
jgi:hypothetical protein